MATGLITSGIQTNQAWNINFYITCDSTTTVTGEGSAKVFTITTAANVGSLAGLGTTTVTNTSAQSIEPYIDVGNTGNATSITLEQFIVQGM